MGLYKIFKDNEIVESEILGEFSGWTRGKIFGSLDCASGMLMKKDSRVFFHTLEDAVGQGYRPCKKCRPMNVNDFEQMKHLIPEYATLEDFYNSDAKS